MTIKEDRHKVRISFKHGNPISLNLKGCGNLYIQPYKDYFFENAPIQFINYLSQLRRLGVTYKLTSDKKGCFMTVDLSGYNSNDPKEVLTRLRSNRVNNPPKISRNTSVEYKEDQDETPSLIPNDTFQSELNEISLDKVKEAIETAKENANSQLTPDDLNDDSILSPDTNTEVTNEVTEPVETNSEIKVTKEEVESMSKGDLINLAQSISIPNVSELWTKKELRSAIIDKLAL